MTEDKWWLSEYSPAALVLYLCQKRRLNRTKSGRRKFWLFGCGCCRRHWDLFQTEPPCVSLILAAERFADGESPFSEITACDRLLDIPNYGRQQSVMLAARSLAYSNAQIVATTAAEMCAYSISRELESPDEVRRMQFAELSQAAHLLRCIFGNPFRPVAVDPQWLTSTVTQLAQGIYDDRAFDRLPILADALQDAGCENADVLNHCRDTGPHARGCWVVDLVLGKT